MAKELVKVAIAEGIDAKAALDGIDLVVEVRVRGDLLLDKLALAIKGEWDDKVIAAVKAFLLAQQAKPAALPEV